MPEFRRRWEAREVALTFNQNGTVTYFTQVGKRAEDPIFQIIFQIRVPLCCVAREGECMVIFSLSQISKRLSVQRRRQLRMGESDLTDLDPADVVEEGLSAQHLHMRI